MEAIERAGEHRGPVARWRRFDRTALHADRDARHRAPASILSAASLPPDLARARGRRRSTRERAAAIWRFKCSAAVGAAAITRCRATRRAPDRNAAGLHRRHRGRAHAGASGGAVGRGAIGHGMKRRTHATRHLRSIIAIGSAALLLAAANAGEQPSPQPQTQTQQQTLALWPGGAPGSELHAGEPETLRLN